MSMTPVDEATLAEAPIRLTAAAAREARRLMAKQAEPDRVCLRLGVRGGGCSGFSYVVELATEVAETDRSFEEAGVRVVVDPRSLKILRGSTLDYDTSNLLEGGFRFENPNAKRTCGCGTSFQL